MNSVNIIGNITKDINLKYLPSGLAVADFSIAVNQDYKKQDGTKVEKTSFFDIKVLGRQSETINNFFRKGSKIGITGELEQETWTANDGSNRSKVVIKLQQFTFIDRKQDNQQSNSYQQPQQGYNQNPSVEYQRNDNPPQQQSIPEINISSEDIPF